MFQCFKKIFTPINDIFGLDFLNQLSIELHKLYVSIAPNSLNVLGVFSLLAIDLNWIKRVLLPFQLTPWMECIFKAWNLHHTTSTATTTTYEKYVIRFRIGFMCVMRLQYRWEFFRWPSFPIDRKANSEWSKW